jgi:hypothetical protein
MDDNKILKWNLLHESLNFMRRNLETETFLVTEVTGEIDDSCHTTDFSLDDFIEEFLLCSWEEKEVD